MTLPLKLFRSFERSQSHDGWFYTSRIFFEKQFSLGWTWFNGFFEGNTSRTPMLWIKVKICQNPYKLIDIRSEIYQSRKSREKIEFSFWLCGAVFAMENFTIVKLLQMEEINSLLHSSRHGKKRWIRQHKHSHKLHIFSFSHPFPIFICNLMYGVMGKNSLQVTL